MRLPSSDSRISTATRIEEEEGSNKQHSPKKKEQQRRSFLFGRRRNFWILIFLCKFVSSFAFRGHYLRTHCKPFSVLLTGILVYSNSAVAKECHQER
jgi:hypothetical protein